MSLLRVSSFLVKFWLIVAILTAVYGIYYVYLHGIEGNIAYLLLPLIAFAFYFLRKRTVTRLRAAEAAQAAAEAESIVSED